MPSTQKGVDQFMNREQLAAFCTVGRNHEPHVVPVFFTYDDGRVYVQAERTSMKVRNLAANTNVAVAIYQGEEAVVIRGTGRIIDRNEFVRRTWEHVHKYQLQLDEYGRDSLGIPLFDAGVRCVIEVTPRRMIFW